MIPNLQNYITIETSQSPQTIGPIPAKEVKFISDGDPHFVAVHVNSTATTAALVSFLVPQGVAMDATMPFNTTISVRCHQGLGHFTVAY